MNEIIAYLNSAFAFLLDLLIWPLRGLPAVWGLVFLSALSGIALLYFFGLISNQTAIRNTKRKIHAALLESILFRHDIKLCLGAQGRMLKSACVYFVLALVPLMILSIPAIYFLGHLNARYNSRPLQPGETTLVGIQVKPQADLFSFAINTTEGLEKDAMVRVPAEHQVVFRVKVGHDGKQAITIEDKKSGLALSKPLYVGSASSGLESYSYSTWWWSLMYPGGEIVGKAKDALESFWVEYPERDYSVFGIQMHWLVIFLIFSLISGLIASRVFKIEI
ncbi:MAG: hypothetical protein J5J00_08350 [Deltaproteobacteria bacterium]|nr:hypothetical protein [Deltaproteobacteria bacterium]